MYTRNRQACDKSQTKCDNNLEKEEDNNDLLSKQLSNEHSQKNEQRELLRQCKVSLDSLEYELARDEDHHHTIFNMHEERSNLLLLLEVLVKCQDSNPPISNVPIIHNAIEDYARKFPNDAEFWSSESGYKTLKDTIRIGKNKFGKRPVYEKMIEWLNNKIHGVTEKSQTESREGHDLRNRFVRHGVHMNASLYL